MFYRFFILLLFFSFSNCATYWGNRKNDLKDILTIGVERKGFGTGLRLGPLAAGLVFQGGSERKLSLAATGYGLRGGHFGKYYSRQLIFGILGGETFYAGEIDEETLNLAIEDNEIPVSPDERDNLKSFRVRYFSLYHSPLPERKKQKKEEFQRAFADYLIKKTGDNSLKKMIPEKSYKTNGYPPSYPYELDFYAGIYYGIRLGINISEILDFIFGFTGYDLLDDDI